MIGAAVIFAFITGFLGRYIAKQKGRSGAEGFWIGFLFSLLGVIIVALMPTVYKTEKKINYERNNSVKEAVSIKSSSSSTTHLTDKEIELIAKEQNKKDTKSNIYLTIFLIVLVGWAAYALYQNEKETKSIIKNEIEKPVEIFEEKKEKPKPKPKPKPVLNKVSLEKQLSSLIKSFDKLVISDSDANSIAKSFVILEKDFIQNRKITSAKQLVVNYERGSFDGYYRILLDFNGVEVYKSAPFKSRLSTKEAKSIEKLISEKSKSYRDLIKEIVVYDDVVNTIEVDLIKLDINLEKINRVEIIKLLNYSIQVTLYDNNKLLSRINSTIPSSWLDKLELKKVYSASIEPKP